MFFTLVVFHKIDVFYIFGINLQLTTWEEEVAFIFLVNIQKSQVLLVLKEIPLL